MKKKMALCTPIPEEILKKIEEKCEVTVCGELKHGRGNVTEDIVREECMGHELVVLGDEYAGADTIKAWDELPPVLVDQKLLPLPFTQMIFQSPLM